jgi:predicted esterase
MKHLLLALALLVTPQDDRAKALHDYACGESDKRPDLAGLDWKAVHAALKEWKAPAPEKVETELSHSHTLSNGHEATFFYYVPKSYDPSKPATLAIFLHGGVNSPQRKRGARQWTVWKEMADAKGWIAASPSATDQNVWWKPEGEEHVLETIRYLAARHAIDRNRVIVSGFSDGASGAYFLGMVRTDLWAASIPWNGAVGVVVNPNGGNTPFYTSNCRTLAWRATHGGKDQLYPSASQKPVIDAMKAAGVPVEWKDFEEVGHDGGRIIGGDRDFIGEWLPKQARNPLPESIDWTTHDAKRHGRAYWLRVLEIGERPGDPFDGEKDSTFPVGQAGPPRPVLGVQIEQAFGGPGVKIAGVQDGSGAAEAGLKSGDVINEANGEALRSFDDLRAVLGKAKSGDKVKLSIDRDGKTVELEVAFRPIKVDAAKVVPAGRLRATRKGNTVEVLAKRVAKFEILVPPDAFDLGKEIVVTVNGKEQFKGTVTPDAGVVLDEARARHGDASVAFVARIVIEVPEKKEY